MEMVEALTKVEESLQGYEERQSKKWSEWMEAEGSKRDGLAKQFEELSTQVEGLNEVMRDLKSRPSFSGIEVGDGEKGKFSFGRMAQLITRVASPDDPEYGYELEVHKAGLEQLQYQPDHVKTAISGQTDGSGGFLIPVEVQNEIIPELTAMVIAAKLGATVINGLTSNLQWVVNNGGIAASYVNTPAEQSGTETTPSFDAIELKPHVAAAFVPLTWEMLAQPAVSLDSWVRNEIAIQLALREDLSFFLGTGSSSEPRGLFNNSQVPTHSFNGGSALSAAGWGQGGSPAPVIDEELLSMVWEVAKRNGITPNARLGFAMGVGSHMNLAIAKDSQSRNLWLDSRNEGILPSVFGMPIESTTQLDNTTTITANRWAFGDYSRALIGRWGAVAFAASDTTETNFRKLRTTIRGISAHDTVALQPDSFCVSTNVDLTNAKFNPAA